MKIVIAAEIFPPDIGGPATYSKRVVEELVKRGWQANLICYSDKKHQEGDPPYVHRIKRSKLKIWHYKKYFTELKELAKDSDIIYAQGPVASGWPALRVKRLTGKKLVVKVVGDYAWERARNSGETDIGIDKFQNQRFTGKIGRLRKIERMVCQKADKIIVPSQYLKKIVSGWGVSEDKIEVIYNSFELQFESRPINKNLIVSVGRLVPWKGFETLIELMPELLKENKEFKLVISGDGPQREKLINLAENLNLKDKNVVIGSMRHDQVIFYLTQASVFVLNSGYEGLSHTILEAMAAGVPVITTNVGGNPELIKDGENGLLVEYDNKEQLKSAILKLYNNPELRQKFVNNSKAVLKKFTFNEMMEKTIKVLKSVKHG